MDSMIERYNNVLNDTPRLKMILDMLYKIRGNVSSSVIGPITTLIKPLKKTKFKF